MTRFLAFKKLRQEDLSVQNFLGYIEKPYLETKREENVYPQGHRMAKPLRSQNCLSCYFYLSSCLFSSSQFVVCGV